MIKHWRTVVEGIIGFSLKEKDEEGGVATEIIQW